MKRIQQIDDYLTKNIDDSMLLDISLPSFIVKKEDIKETLYYKLKDKIDYGFEINEINPNVPIAKYLGKFNPTTQLIDTFIDTVQEKTNNQIRLLVVNRANYEYAKEVGVIKRGEIDTTISDYETTRDKLAASLLILKENMPRVFSTIMKRLSEFPDGEKQIVSEIQNRVNNPDSLVKKEMEVKNIINNKYDI